MCNTNVLNLFIFIVFVWLVLLSERSSVSYNFVLHFFLAIYFFVATDIDNIFTQFIYKNVL